jgi:hypothetical protein
MAAWFKIVLGEDPKTTICGYIAGGLCGIVVAALPGLTMDSTLQQTIAAGLMVSLGSLGRFTNESKKEPTPIEAINSNEEKQP